MPEPTPLPTAAPMRAEDSYRPVAGLAIASVILAGVFALLVLVNASVGLVKGLPFFLSNWLLLFPIAAAALSFVAQRQIRNSEGTRAGLVLAKWGMWLSVLFGLGYGTYAATTHFAVRRQAEDFLLDRDKGFFAVLKKPGGANAAFLLTRPPDDREGLNPSDIELMQKRFSRDLLQFLDHSLVRSVQQAGPDAEVTLSGMKPPIYFQGGYLIDAEVNVKTPDVQAQFSLGVRSQDGRNGREWYVDWTRTGESLKKNAEPTRRGASLWELRGDSHRWAAQWLGRLKAGKLNKKDLIPNEEGLDLGALRNPKISKQVATLFQRLCDPGAGRRPILMEEILCCMPQPAQGGMQRPTLVAYYAINKKNNRLQITHEARLTFVDQEDAGPTGLLCLARIIVERTDGGGLASSPSRPASWKVVRLEISRAEVRSNRGQG
jgi:hypothetical protein